MGTVNTVPSDPGTAPGNTAAELEELEQNLTGLAGALDPSFK